MDIGIMLPQGFLGEYDGWDPGDAWQRTAEVAGQAEKLGFESIWLVDHFHTSPEIKDEITFESFTSLSALAAITNRVQIGHAVVCTAWRNPAITAKMISTMDVISGGRMTLGIGAGWKQDEWEAYGYRFPAAPERLAILRDHLKVIAAMLGPGRATVTTGSAHVAGAVNQPKGAQNPRVPIMVGGNGPDVTWRLAARYADELNFDGKLPEEVAEAVPIIRSRCDEIGRDFDSLRLSGLTWAENVPPPGARRIDMLHRYAEAGLGRLMVRPDSMTNDDGALEALAADAADAGFALAARRTEDGAYGRD